MQVDSLKAISGFLEANKLTDTLSALTREIERLDHNRKVQRNRASIQNIARTRIDLNDQTEVVRVRNTLQKADQSALQRLVTKLNSKLSRDERHPNKGMSKLKQMGFYKKLVEKEQARLTATVRKGNQKNLDQISGIQMEVCNDDSIISRPEQAIRILEQDMDEYEDANDIGYDTHDLDVADFQTTCGKIAYEKRFPSKAVLPNSQNFPIDYYKDKDSYKKDLPHDLTNHIRLPKNLVFPKSNDDFYPIQFAGIIYDTLDLKLVFDQNKVGFDQERNLDLSQGRLIAGRYRVIQIMGSAQFSTAVRVEDILTRQQFCMKVISNNKDYVDQSLDQIKLLLYININGNVDQKCVLKLHDFLYYKQHLIIVTELLKTDLYKTYTESIQPSYFDLKCIQRVSKQILVAMEYIHSLHIIHSDLKPQNILMKSYSQQLIKVIDFGNSAFFHDTLTYYIQTRSYRAPEVIIGCPYDQKIDIWSVGCIVAELFTGRMLFENESVPALLAKHQGIVGPWPEWMLQKGKNFQQFFTKNLVIFQAVTQEGNKQNVEYMKVYVPKKSNIASRLGTDDPYFVDFVKSLLQLDPTRRPSASEALRHPFLTEARY